MLEENVPVRKEGAERDGMGDQRGDLPFLVLHILGVHVRLKGFGADLVPGWSELKLTQPESWQGSRAHLMTIIEEMQGYR